jgi:ribosome-associated protein
LYIIARSVTKRKVETMADEVRVNSTFSIPMAELTFRFSRSGGPGGQNVNKVSTRVEVEFDVAKSPSLLEPQRQRLMRRLGRRLDSQGVLRVQADDSRSQWQNRLAAIQRLAETIAETLKVPKKRIPSRRTTASNSRRLEEKKRRAHLKRRRRGDE